MLRKSWYLDPEEPIDEFITELTGIDDTIIDLDAVPYQTFVDELLEIIKQYNCFVNPVQWGQGDSQCLKNELRLRNIDFPVFGRRDIDVKQLCVFQSIVEGKKTSGGLKSYLARYKVNFEGTPHRADWDAYNTLKLFFALIERQKTIEDLVRNIKEL